MRATSLVLLSIAIMALLLTDADAKRRSSAQGGGGGQRKLVRDLFLERHQRQLQFCHATTVSGPGVGARRPQSVSGHALRDRLHLVVTSTAANTGRVLEIRPQGKN